ncbi:class I SAM-dependent methyltransferase [Paucibacter sp. Y2R2-4]|uniref:class I SAM-dependent methyltransferase n=1 Tax=Paucibacter sp. Y2R2-4 TaxID=2893553 RepID=UPI0021E46070|nr:class I SAM-dependent methyltransferase [Paucibacter sp. Y2R2-4]MCV2349762.1 class I SAM-dependent methyltransferase [Paucibacter sp. Y2R2-4]
MNSPLIAQLFSLVERKHPRSLQGILEARAQNPEEFERIAHIYLTWCVGALGQSGISESAAAFANFCSDVNLAQGRYELSGAYEHKSFDECRSSVYDNTATMTDYLWGVYLSNFLWAHHLDLLRFFEQRFLSRLTNSVHLVEVAPGHGGWGLWALSQLTEARLTGFDVSATSIKIAGSIARAAGLADRAEYQLQDASLLSKRPSPQAQACICSFLVEHLENPSELLKGMAHALEPGGLAFFTGALTAAQVDHIYEFKTESELYVLAENAGFRVLESRSVAPGRLLQNASYLPRSMALILQKKTHALW